MSIAIVGIGCRFPGGANSPSKLWTLIEEGRDGIGEVPAGRWSLKRHQCDDPEVEGKHRPRRGGFLEQGLELFDSQFFGLLPREADSLDPQQRLLLEVTWEAFEDAGIPVESLAGTSTGVYVGGFTRDQMIQHLSPLTREVVGPNTATGLSLTMLSNRLSYTFDLRGPSFSVDTACSSSLTAFSAACRDLMAGRTTAAIVGGVNAMVRPEFPMVMSRGGFLAADGHCKPFDSRANGYGRGEGAGVVMLKSLEDARADGDRVYAVVRGVGVNQDGRTAGITVPNPEAQSALIEEVYREFELDPAKVVYVEAHGTGTPVGDPIEARAIGGFLGKGRDTALPIGSIKANINHTEAAAGVAGVIKAALVLHHKTVPPLANLDRPNPEIPFEELGLELPRKARPRAFEEGLVSINSFGYGGTNAHAVLASSEAPESWASRAPRKAERRFLFPLSAASGDGLREMAGDVAAAIEGSGPDLCVEALVHSARERRSLLAERLVVQANSRMDLATRLQKYADTGLEPQSVDGRAMGEAGGPVFVYTGMGPQWWAMGQQLYRKDPIFREAADEIDAAFEGQAGFSILEKMLAEEEASEMARNDVAQPANFVLQAALTRWWNHRGVMPSAIVGHSVGEVTAAWAAGALSLEEAARVSYHRSRIQQQRAGEGTLLAIGMSAEEAEALLQIYGDDVDIAAINSPSSCALAGPRAVLQEIAEILEGEGYFAKMLYVEVAYHSRQMEGLRDEVLQSLSALQPRPPEVELYSTVSGDAVREAIHDGQYWWKNVRQPVRLADATRSMLENGHSHFLEIGPHPVLGPSIRDTAAGAGQSVMVASSLRRNRDEEIALMEAASQLFAAGAELSLEGFGPTEEVVKAEERPFVRLPGYPWQRERHWAESRASRDDRCAEPEHPLLGLEEPGAINQWRAELSPAFAPYIEDHQVEGAVVVPGALWIETLLAATRQLCETSSVVIESLQLDKARVVQPKEVVHLQTTYLERERRLEVASKSGEDSFTLHGTARFSEMQARQEAPGESASLNELRRRLRASESFYLEGDKLYDRLEKMGLHYGPAFRRVAAVEVGDGVIRARLSVEECYDTVLVPPVLDGAFQALVALDGGADRPMIPVGADRVESVKPVDRERDLVVMGEILERSDRSLLANLWLIEEETKVVVARVRGLRCRAIGAAQGDEELSLAHEAYYEGVDLDEVSEEFERPILVVADGSAEALVAGIQKEWPHARAATTDGWHEVASEMARSGPYALFLAMGSGEIRPGQKDSRTGVDAIGGRLQLLQTLVANRPLWPERLVYLSCGGAAMGPERPVALDQSALIGFGRVMSSEYPELAVGLVDVDPRALDQGMADALKALIAGEDEVAIDLEEERPIRAYRLRRRPDVEPEARSMPVDEPFGLEQTGQGSLDGIRFVEKERRPPSEGEVEVQVKSVPLGFKDALKLLGLLSEYLLEGTFFGQFVGMEGAAQVVAVGDGVEDYQVGDPVAVISDEGMFHSYLTLPVRQVFGLPTVEGASFDELAAQIVVFVTSIYGLEDIAGVQPGETVLLHSATGGVGLSALQVARGLGATVIATAGTPEKRRYLRDRGVEHVFDSRSLSFVDDVRAATEGRGVDVVLNFLTGELLEQSLGLLAPFGRFVEIGKRDIDANNPLPMGYFNENLHFASVDIDRMIAQRLDLFRRLYDRLMGRFADGTYQVIPCRFEALASLSDLLREMMQAKHRGKIGVQFRGSVDVYDDPGSHNPFRPDRSYVITGGLGGFGLQVARRALEQGAGSVALLSRRGPATEGSEEILAELQLLAGGRGDAAPAARAFACDVTDAAALEATLSTIRREMEPIGGIFHAAAVLDDGLLAGQSAERIARVMEPKARGALLLDALSADDELDHFVLFSSIAALVGNPGQGAYAAANAMLDALAIRRRHRGKPALSINWGVLGDVGMAARDPGVLEHLEKVGIAPLSPEEALDALQVWMGAELAHLGIMRVDWSQWAAMNPSRAEGRRFLDLLEGDQLDVPAVAELREVEASERLSSLVEMTVSEVAKTLRVSPDRLDGETGLDALGVDSLMSVEIQAALQLRFGVQISTLELSGAASTSQIAALIWEQLEPQL